jgi:hypothetical protein
MVCECQYMSHRQDDAGFGFNQLSRFVHRRNIEAPNAVLQSRAARPRDRAKHLYVTLFVDVSTTCKPRVLRPEQVQITCGCAKAAYAQS